MANYDIINSNYDWRQTEERAHMKRKQLMLVLLGIPMATLMLLISSYVWAGGEGKVHTVSKGDTLWDISGKYLGDPQNWPDIWEMNRYLSNPNYIYPGLKIVVTSPGTIREEFLISDKEAPKKMPPPPMVKKMKKPTIPIKLSRKEALASGELLLGKPGRVGSMIETTDEKVIFSPGDRVYLSLKKDFKAGKELGIFRVEGPVYVPGMGRKGYKNKYIGKVRVEGKFRDRYIGTVTELYEEALRSDYLEEHIPMTPSFEVRLLKDGKRGEIVCAAQGNYEFSEGDVLYVKGGEKGGFVKGDVLNIYIPLKSLQKLTVTVTAKNMAKKGDLVYVGKGVIIRTNEHFSTLFVVDSLKSFNVPALVVRGEV